jgi:acyl-coenzyme A thioesterase PaaI-like protein
MSDELVREMNEFFATRVPGLLGVETVEIGPDRVVGKMEVTAPLIAGTGYLFAPAVIALATRVVDLTNALSRV